MASLGQSGKITLKQEERKRFFFLGCLLLLSLLALCALALVPIELMIHIIPPVTKLASGPLYHGMFVFIPPLVLSLYIMIRMKYLASILKGYLAHSAYFFISKHKQFNRIIFSGSFLIYFYGLSLYWFATPDGVFISRSWFSAPQIYQWKDVTQRRVSCSISGKQGQSFSISFILRFADAFEIDVAPAPEDYNAKNFQKIIDLTNKADTIKGDVSIKNCPNAVSVFIAKR